uniref:CASP-like protein n=1 Tax=Anthurium amnicola TaxID=1678845 RepID=A0A1D1YP05_9ARAE
MESGKTAVATAGAEAGAAAAKAAETVLRVVPMGLCLAAMAVMLKNTQESGEFGDVSYADLSGFRYLVYADGICAAYSLFSAFYTAATARRPPSLSRSWTLFFFDQVVTYVVLAAGAAAAEILYLAHHGDKEVTWSKACGVFGGFCRRAAASAGATFGAAACYVGLSLVSSHRLFSSYSAPHVPFLPKAVEVAAPPFSA